MHKEYNVEIDFIGENKNAVKEKICPIINQYNNTNFNKLLNNLGITPNPKLKIFNVDILENGEIDFTVKESDKNIDALNFVYDFYKKLLDRFFPEFYINLIYRKR